ncbi:MAG TPA: peptidylprolyl isomerase [Gaiellaceae bacterium]
MKTRLPFLLVPLLLVALLAACGGGGNSGPVPADSVAKVGSTTITKASLNSLIDYAFANEKAQGQPTPKVGTPAYTQLRDQAVTFLVNQVEWAQEGQKMGVSVPQKDVQKQVDLIKSTRFNGSQTKLDDALKKAGITLAQLEQFNIEPNLLTQRLQAKVTASVKVSNAAALKYYNQNKATFTTPKTREVRHILVKTKSLADKIESELKGGASFAKLAKQYSKDTASAAQGGKLCVAHGGSSGACQQTVPPFDKASFSLKTNEIAVVHSVYGWHVIQPIADVKPAHVQTFAEAKPQIQTSLSQQQQSVAWQNWLAKVAKDYKGKVSYQSGYAPATTRTSTTPAPATTTG